MNNTGNTGGFVPVHPSNMITSATMIGTSPVQIREIDAAMNELSNETEQLALLVNSLFERLGSVLIPQVQASQTQVGNPIPARFHCVLATAIDNQIGYVRTNRERLQEMLAALQL